jgi:hypothetical protein
MAEQLILLEPEASRFRLDDHTRHIGRQGIAEVRRILAEKIQAAEASRLEPGTDGVHHHLGGAAAA